ncbi:MAG: cobalt ECF transporter T component CbiQ [Actinobacteria bacterium]|nr:cobalt ECF transporter T component CbiQ [Actinomycetota bacterium]
MGAGHAHALYQHGHSTVHRMGPEAKLAAGFASVVAIATTPREAVWAFALHAAVLAAVVTAAELPPRFVLRRLAIVLPFVAFAFTIPFVAGGEEVTVLGVGLSRDGLWGTWNVLAKAVLGASVSIVVAGTTEEARIFKGLERLRVPVAITLIATFMLRYLTLIADELRRTRVAMRARGYAPRWLWEARPVASAAGAVFVRSYERGERVHAAMLARGFTGTMPELDTRTATRADWLRGATVAGVVAATALAAAVTT